MACQDLTYKDMTVCHGAKLKEACRWVFAQLMFPYMKGRSHTVNTGTRKVRVPSPPGCGIGERDHRMRRNETELHSSILKIRA